MDTQEHVEMWSQVPHKVQKPHSHSWGKLILGFPSPSIRIELQSFECLVFFFPPLKKKKKKTTKVPASGCPKAGRQDRMWENCHHLLPKYQPSTGTVQTAGLGKARNYPDHQDVPLPLEESIVLVLVSGQGALLR